METEESPNSRNGYSKKTVNSSNDEIELNIPRDRESEFEPQLVKKYPLALRSWHTHWDELAAMFKYSPQIRRIIYTTNAIENFNRQLRKVTKNKGSFVSDDVLMKILYLATMNISDKWTMTVKDWGNILNNLIVHFGERVKGYI